MIKHRIGDNRGGGVPGVVQAPGTIHIGPPSRPALLFADDL